MEKYKLKITTRADEEETVFFLDAALKYTQRGRVLTYFQGEGKTLLYLEEARLSRSGDYGLELTFDRKERTFAKLTFGENTGLMPMDTLEYSLFETRNEIFITIEYILRQEGGCQRMKVCMEAKKAVATVS